MKNKSLILLLGLLCILQAFFIFSIFPTSKDSLNEPFLYRDHAIHYAQTLRMISFFKTGGRLSGYDPYFMAGYPSTFFDLVDNCGLFVFCLLLSPFISVAASIKTFIFFMVILLPLVLFIACRNFGLDLKHSYLAALLLIFVCNVFWFYRRLITYGTYSYLFAVFFALLAFSCI
ncbi:MAG: hypothetical protein JW867_07130, partial [Candidatus Omnitrophica bacterium]|nr:hypothetical protein [Candidatus Omnitrophota bacterium]